MKINYEEFLNSSPRQIQTLDYYNMQYDKNIMMRAYTDIHTPINSKNAESGNKEYVNDFNSLF